MKVASWQRYILLGKAVSRGPWQEEEDKEETWLQEDGYKASRMARLLMILCPAPSPTILTQPWQGYHLAWLFLSCRSTTAYPFPASGMDFIHRYGVQL
jgi:hypothetical protein